MAIKRTSSNSLVNATKMSTGFSSAAIPNTPTIGAATATSVEAATVAYTAAVLGANGVTFTATSNPSSITGTGSSPITVTGLTASTSYTFSVTAGNANGTSAASSASNSITTSAPPSSYDSIATVTVGSPQATISFTSIPANYKHLQIRAIVRSSTSGADAWVLYTLNSDTTSSNYDGHYFGGNGTNVDSPFSGFVNNDDGNIVGRAMGSASGADNNFAANIIDILDYADTSKYKVARNLTGQDNNGSRNLIMLESNLWRNTAAISSISFTTANNFAQYTQFALYGIKG